MENLKNIKHYEKLQELTLMDDIFMSKAFNNKKAIEELLRKLIQKEDLEIVEFNTEEEIKNIIAHSVKFDILAKDINNKIYNIEIQKSSSGAIPERARFYSSSLDIISLKKGESYDNLPETYIIFITSKDVLKDNLHIYHVDRFVRETKKLFNDRAHIIYFNTSKIDDTEFGILAKDLNQKDPNKIQNNTLREIVKDLKESEEGVKEMSDVMEQLLEEGRQEGRIEGRQEGKIEGIEEIAKNMLKENLSIELIEKLTTLSKERINSLR